MSDGASGLPDGTTAAVGAAVVGGGGGFFWWLVRNVMSAREARAEEFRQEVRADLKELKALVQAYALSEARLEARLAALETRVDGHERTLERLSEGR